LNRFAIAYLLLTSVVSVIVHNLSHTIVQCVPDRPLVTLKCSQVTAPTLT
jgi:hypothetical protein